MVLMPLDGSARSSLQETFDDLNKEFRTALFRNDAPAVAESVRRFRESDLPSDALTAAVNMAGAGNVAPLHVAVSLRNKEIVNTLVTVHGIILDTFTDEGETALHTACALGQIEIVQTLLQAGANVHLKDKIIGFAPLHHAAASFNWKTIKPLLKAKASIRTRSELDGLSAIHICTKRNYTDCVKYLLSQVSAGRLGNHVCL